MLQYGFNSLCSIELTSEERTTRGLKGVARFFLRFFIRHLNENRLVNQEMTNTILQQFVYYFKGLTSFYFHIPIITLTLGYAETDRLAKSLETTEK